MTKIYYRYGCMDSSKTTRLLMDAYDYTQRGQYVLLLKPIVDTRSKKGRIESRIGLSAPCLDITKNFNVLDYIASHPEQDIASIFVDEAQWLTTEQVIQLRIIADEFGVPSMCYGLKSDFLGNLWEGATALFAHANRAEEVKNMCRHENCKHKAMYNARFKNGKPTFEGKTIIVGDTQVEENKYYYLPMCSKHYFAIKQQYYAELYHAEL